MGNMSSTLNNLAALYIEVKKPEKAEKYILRAIELERQAKTPGKLAVRLGKAGGGAGADQGNRQPRHHAEGAQTTGGQQHHGTGDLRLPQRPGGRVTTLVCRSAPPPQRTTTARKGNVSLLSVMTAPSFRLYS